MYFLTSMNCQINTCFNIYVPNWIYQIVLEICYLKNQINLTPENSFDPFAPPNAEFQFRSSIFLGTKRPPWDHREQRKMRFSKISSQRSVIYNPIGTMGDPNMILNGAGGFLWITAILITALWSVCWRTYPLPFAPKITQYFPTVVLLCYESEVLCVPLIPMMGHFSRPGDGFGAHTLWTLVHRLQPPWSRNVTVLIFSQNYHL